MPSDSRLGKRIGTSSAPDRQSRARRGTKRQARQPLPFAEWCPKFIEHTIDRFAGSPFELEPFQREFMAEALAADDAGRFEWQSVALVLPRKNGKTALLAAYALWRLMQDDGQPEILLAAASDKQAGRLFEQVVHYIRRNRALEREVYLREYIGEIVCIQTGGKIMRMASKPQTLHGYNPSLVICDELAQWTMPSQRKAWAALTTGGGARDRTQNFTISVAGDHSERAEGILGRMIDANESFGEVERPHDALTISRNREASILIYNYSAPTTDPYEVAEMKKANPASWISEEYLARQAANPELEEGDVLQLHGCVWSATSRGWLKAGLWDACAKPRKKVKEQQIVLGFDGSYGDDSTALVGATVEEKPHLFVLGLWERPKEFGRREWHVPRDHVEAAVFDALEKYDVIELAADPPGWMRELEEWNERYDGVVVTDFRTQLRKFMAQECAKMHSAIVNRKLSHDGHRRLAAHVANAVTKETPDGAYITKPHRDSPAKIDAATAAVIAYSRARHHFEQGQSVYEERGFLVLNFGGREQ